MKHTQNETRIETKENRLPEEQKNYRRKLREKTKIALREKYFVRKIHTTTKSKLKRIAVEASSKRKRRCSFKRTDRKWRRRKFRENCSGVEEEGIEEISARFTFAYKLRVT
ncbi:hypothetical protein Nepgr_014359 [Nepenthes gracilis]|uniref:Uncharacterized protein n=1 Tax=Nepenthes gracilis TaxID=150966 RepID=A0AAD3SJV9_NEPGR|nr:hypothetical protein Nepgr_014359 [Nepenthes gracilis]